MIFIQNIVFNCHEKDSLEYIQCVCFNWNCITIWRVYDIRDEIRQRCEWYLWWIQKTVVKAKSNFACNRRDFVIMTRLRLGHCGFRSDTQMESVSVEIIKHVLIQWKNYSSQSNKLFKDLWASGVTAFTLSTFLNLDSWTKIKKLMDYLHHTGLYKYN